ncbi:hypothetical protein IWW38_003653 [Coemansia aciculifera]|uniref:Uncharacterized protein n=1 Tax=Coemansia aciculifera TaxID=417176 RepID=A0ACC1M163_9FUNG|nr:hypothetical protein IWW38_003653 [Coemansia aciculifera]
MENDPREFHIVEEDEDEMENEFGGAGTYNQELQSIFQEMFTHILGRPINPTDTVQQQQQQQQGDAAAAASASAAHHGDEQEGGGIHTWTSTLGDGGTVSVSIGGYPSAEQQNFGRHGSGSSEHPRRPMFIDPEENAPISLANVMSSLLGALGGNIRGAGGAAGGGGGIGIFGGVPIGNLGDYAWGQNSIDDIITQIMEQNQGVHAPPPASQEAILKLPRRPVTGEELQRNMDCGICMEEYVPEEYAVELPCKHLYHKECIDHWLGMNGTCPICRATVGASMGPTEGAAGAAAASSTHASPFMPGSYPTSPVTAPQQQEEGAEQQQEQQEHPEPEPMD